MNSNVLEKIKKLLSLATSDNANERDAALAKAQRIAVENNVDLALIDMSTVGLVKEEEMIEDKFSIGRTLSAHKRFVTSIVTQAAGVEVVYWNSYNAGRSVSFLGPKSSVEFARWLYSFLLDEYVRRWNYERKAFSLPAAHRNTFYLGIFHGQQQKLREAKEEAESAAITRHVQAAAVQPEVSFDESSPSPADFVTTKTAELTQRYTLAVQNQTASRKAFLNKLHPRLGTLRSSRVSIRSHDTYSSGTSHGRSIGLNRPLNG